MTTERDQHPAGVGVLVVGGDDWSVGAAAAQLGAAGCVVHRCHDSVDAPFPCNALVPGRGCPLDQGEVGVVLAVRGNPRTEVTLGEMGAICGLRAGIPVVTGGLHGSKGLARFATPIPDGGNVVTACGTAARRSPG